MIIGVVAMIALVALIEFLRKLSLDKMNLSEDTKNIIVAIIESLTVVLGYTLLFRVYEKREIKELSASAFGKYATLGFIIGILLQSLFILVIYIGGTYAVDHVNPVSTLITPLAFSLTAGFVAEILIIGIVFRLLEEQSGTVIALTAFIILFAVLHLKANGATFVSVGATALQAGFMLPAAYVFSRNLWLPVFLHFGWDSAEPGIFGGINPSTHITEGLLTSKITGPSLLTGGQTGPQDSLQSLIFCLLTGIVFLVLAKQKNRFIKPIWQRTVSIPQTGTRLQE